jgi:hypothetical protein
MILRPIIRMNRFQWSLFVLATAFSLAGCGEPERAEPSRGYAPIRRGDFDEVGKVSLFQGESCASQIVFVFHGAGSAQISMAAPFRVSQILSDAAHNHKTVHVAGKWRHGKTSGCSYVEAIQADPIRKSFW